MRLLLTLITILWVWSAQQTRAQIDDTRETVKNVGVDEHLGETLDLTMTFTDRSGQPVALGDYFTGDRPVIIAPVYYSCPGLCSLVLNGVRDLIAELTLELGEEYIVLNVSFDPTNTPELATQKAENYFKTLARGDSAERPAAESAWRFLTGKPEQIDALMSQIGFRYKKVEDQYSHSSVLVVASPEGKITRYIYGVQYDAKDMRLALVEASEGKVGDTIDKLLIYCFKFDPKAGKYVPYAWNIMRAGGVFTLLIMAVGGYLVWKR
jgi:protein SCO1/2